MADVNIQQRVLAMSRIPQTDYSTFLAIAAGPPKTYRKVIATDKSLAKYSVKSVNNRGHATGKDWATDRWIEAHDMDVPHSEQVCSSEIGRRLLGAFGSVTTTQPDNAGSPLVYKHVFVPQDADTSRQLPAWSYGEKIGANHNVMFPSCVYEKFSLKGDGLGRLTADWSLRGSGKKTNPSGLTWGTTVDELTGTLVYLYNTQVVHQVDFGGGLVSQACRYNRFSIDLDNALNADEGYRPGCALFQLPGVKTSGLIRGECLFGERNLMSEYEVRLGSGGEEYTALQNQTSLNIQTTFEGPAIDAFFNHKLVIKQPVARYASVDLGESNGMVTVSVKPEPLYSFATGKIIEIELYNDVASYTV